MDGGSRCRRGEVTADVPGRLNASVNKEESRALHASALALAPSRGTREVARNVCLS